MEREKGAEESDKVPSHRLCYFLGLERRKPDGITSQSLMSTTKEDPIVSGHLKLQVHFCYDGWIK